MSILGVLRGLHALMPNLSSTDFAISLADGQSALIAVAGDLHAEYERHIAHALHLESDDQGLFRSLE